MLLRQALRELSARDARIFALHYFEEFPYEAIASEMKLSVNQVGVILHRARRRLREILEPVLKPLAPPATQAASEPRLCSEKGK